ncbi:hypothetical protein [Phenylobacterium sp.]|jgi:hypothetical protein|uniref:hypothetical protein n=1 Tax=Phenylobacterium sp. TaxID=1871053 RepID=UPI002E32F80E|nr:hypothetical protein [Phenylobacterium sp.]HEX3366351.1 hypothetical protein [Phenylobacterium sp.]
MIARGVSPAAVAQAAIAPTLEDRPRAQHTSTTVALSPAAMHALLQAQEQMDKNAPVTARMPTVIAIDQLISQMTDTPPSAQPVADAPLTLRRLDAARQQLTQA